MSIHSDGTRVVRTDTYGAYLWDADANQWKQLITASSMPASFLVPNNSEGVYEIQIAPGNSSIFYMLYNGFVLKSTDKGISWTETAFAQITQNPNDIYRLNGQKMAIDPNNSNVVYVGTPQNGLLMTSDGGSTWTQVAAVPVSLTDASNGNQYPGITGILFDPSAGTANGRTKTIYAASFGNGIFESTDAGGSWIKLAGSPTAIVESAAISNSVYYAASNSALWSFKNGASNSLLTFAGGIHAVAVDPANASHIAVESAGGNLNQSFDGGTTWSGWPGNQFEEVSADIPWLAFTSPDGNSWLGVSAIAFDPQVSGKLLATNGVGFWYTELPPNFTDITSYTWNDQSAGIEQLVANEIVAPPGGKPVVASWDRAFFYISDPDVFPLAYGPTTTVFDAGWSIDYASSNPGFLLGVAEEWNVDESGYSPDGGQSWHPFANQPSFPAGSNAFGGTIAASTPQNIIWAPAGGASNTVPYYTKDGGTTWNPIVVPEIANWSYLDISAYFDKRSVVADRVLANTFYLYAPGEGVFKSANSGDTWTEVHTGALSSYDWYVSEIRSVPGEAGNLFFTGGPQSGYSNEPFMRSTDGGATWTAVANVSEVITFGFGAPAATGGYPCIYIVGWVDNVYGVWRSEDNTATWTQLADWPNGSLDEIKTISGDMNNYGEVYVGFSGSGYAYGQIPDGQCGSANGVSVTSAPTTNLCKTGAPSNVNGSGPFTWSCMGSEDGSTATCSAPRLATGSNAP
jgi:photosystem II stability/assembly factor-like uncharacterized protein